MTVYQRSHLRHHRRIWGFRQKDIAYLLGVTDAYVSRIENGEVTPRLNVSMAMHVLFNVELKDQFPKRYSAIEEAVLARAGQLHERLEEAQSVRALRKKELLRAALNRAIRRNKQHARI